MEFHEKWRGVEVLDDKEKEEMDRLTRRSMGMNEKRIQLLEAEDFIWDAHDHVWESRFQELCTFVALNGHGVIQWQNPLASWASQQRWNYLMRQNGQHTKLTEDRIEKLNSVGFVWEIPMTRVRRTLR
ncbi:hypothetical protein ACHAW5_005553 [Stephanodiscus triporus]|uniref:Helicase-associated domain-containing protein n=1 Tax=Stephanodiscus triporus TaxID=2934178 RepID=A0ABD3MYM4_9STRA